MSRDVPVTFRPLTQWPAGRPRTPESRREVAKFKSPGKIDANAPLGSRYTPPKPMSLERTLDDLDRELWSVQARDVVVQVDVVSEGNLRRDGGMRADARVHTPAVVLTFKRKGVVHTFACDSFTRWQDNLRGIALGLEGLRRLERYGIVQAGEQYRGWQALPAVSTTALTTEQAASVLSRVTGRAFTLDEIIATPARAQIALRSARAKVHPDVTGGSTNDFVLVEEAKRVLEAHHGRPL